MKIKLNEINFADQALLIDSCVIISIFLEEKQETIAMFNTFFHEGAMLTINEINLYEIRYILKSKIGVAGINIDTLINSFIKDYSIEVYKNCEKDYITASNIKSKGGLSPYDALMLAQIENAKRYNYVFITSDREFDKQKFINKCNICFV